jgi:hypothetical protein
MRRRRATWGGVGYNQAGTVADPVSLWHETVHTPGIYNLEVDPSVLRPMKCADLIARHLADGPPLSALQRLAGPRAAQPSDHLDLFTTKLTHQSIRAPRHRPRPARPGGINAVGVITAQASNNGAGNDLTTTFRARIYRFRASVPRRNVSWMR